MGIVETFEQLPSEVILEHRMPQITNSNSVLPMSNSEKSMSRMTNSEKLYRRPSLLRQSRPPMIRQSSSKTMLSVMAPCFPLRTATAAFILTFMGYIAVRISVKSYSFAKSSLIEQDWYDGGDRIILTGMIQILNLFTYAIALFFAGPFIDYFGTRMTIVSSIIISGILTGLFAALGFLQVHAFAPYAIIWALSGIVQSVSGPSLVTIAGSWLNNLPHRGFILCLWSGNQNIGNMIAGIISGICLKGFKYEIAWQGSMLVCGLVSIVMVIPLYWFLVPSPEYDSMELEIVNNRSFSDISFRNLDIDDTDSNDGIPEKVQNRCSMLMKIWNAFFIPGVSVYSLAFAMSKGTNYIYLYWLPYMMTNLKGLSDSQAAYVSTLFDAGAFLGSICAGLLIDYFQKNDIILVYFALNASLSFLLLLPSVTGFSVIAPTLFCLGFFVGGPISVISICASVDIQQKQKMDNNSKHVSSVVPAIIQGSGSLGAVLILFIVSFIIKCPKDGISECSWINLFFFVFVANSFAFFLLAYFYYSDPLVNLLKGLSDYCAKIFKVQPVNLDEIIDEIPKKIEV